MRHQESHGSWGEPRLRQQRWQSKREGRELLTEKSAHVAVEGVQIDPNDPRMGISLANRRQYLENSVVRAALSGDHAGRSRKDHVRSDDLRRHEEQARIAKTCGAALTRHL